MKHFTDIDTNELSGIIINSGITFGDGVQCAGGIIYNSENNRKVHMILRDNNIIIPEKMAIIWLLDSRATTAVLGQGLLYLKDQRRSDKGIWIGWIDESEIDGVERMDGSNL